ncbi:hypothetical protein ALC60_00404 [Trachymyrmex zeteki]|uniref:DNA-directed DNA polymerase n=1 Tax=Mycetomoellerius zeteki TaxID=64791 RepID=A0A151XJD9_9HYME|nr:hypothetical protein ALC60_00404 [Trachymyrmex zeteki]
MVSILIAHGIYEVVTGVRVKPDQEEAAKGWIKDNAKATFLISSTIDYTQLEYLITCQTAHDMWAKLTSMREPQNQIAEAMIAKPNFHSHSVFSENLVTIELRKLEVKFDKPIYVSMCILDISKTCLYEFHEYMAPLFRDKCKIMYMDTDSLIYHVECDDVYDIMKRDINRFDTSDYSVDNAYGIPLANKKVPGLMKDDNNSIIMTDFVGLRAKMYALRVQRKKDTKKAKGVKSSIVTKSITFEDYTRCLNDAIEMTRKQSCIRSKLHEVYTILETKIALSPHDDKRYIVSGSTNTLPWGHYRCK